MVRLKQNHDRGRIFFDFGQNSVPRCRLAVTPGITTCAIVTLFPDRQCPVPGHRIAGGTFNDRSVQDFSTTVLFLVETVASPGEVLVGTATSLAIAVLNSCVAPIGAEGLVEGRRR